MKKMNNAELENINGGYSFGDEFSELMESDNFLPLMEIGFENAVRIIAGYYHDRLLGAESNNETLSQ